MSELASTDMVGNTLHIGDEIIFHTKKYGSCFDVSVVEKIEKDVKQKNTQYQDVRCDKIYFKQKRLSGSWMINKPCIEVIKIVREED